MEGIGKIHPPRHSVQRFGNRGRIFQADARKSDKGRQSSNDLIAPKAITASQYPLGFQQNSRADKNVRAVDQRARTCELLKIIGGQVADDILVSTASTPSLYFGGYGCVHLFQRLRRFAISEHPGYILWARRGKNRCRLQQDPVESVFDRQAGAGPPMPALTNCFGQYDLPFGRHGGDRGVNDWHEPSLMRANG
jgi:hypothetical protein